MKTLFEADRTSLEDALEITKQSLMVHATAYRHWAVAYSGGKDSTATVAAVVYLIESGQVPRPRSLSFLYADTRMELPPLHENALQALEALRARGYEGETVLPELEDRFMVYMLGRGVPPPTNTFRWCTDQLKIQPMAQALRRLSERVGERPLLLIGLRLGESAARDQRIALGCGRNGGECGQGWFQTRPSADAADTLSPLLHWRTCHVWDWLLPYQEKHGLPTALVAEVYDQDAEGSANEVAARTGCVGCNLASQDFSLQRVLRKPQWSHLEPLRRLKPLWQELREHSNRLRKGNDERRKDGTLVSNPGRIGPLTLEARRYGLAEVLGIQQEVNFLQENAPFQRRVPFSLINDEEEARIRELIAANTWPDRWDGSELPGDVDLPDVFPDGTMQPLLFGG